MVAISVLLPTRGRHQILPVSVDSLLRNASIASDVQICYAVDDDDKDTLALMGSGEFARPDLDRVVVSERHGYAGLHHYVNALAGVAEGQWMFLWNDDAIMHTPNWDRVVYRFDPTYVLDCWSNHPPETCAFPIVPAQWVRFLGHFSHNAHNDTWWQEIGTRLHRLVRVDIDVFHQRFDMTGLNGDDTYWEKVEQHQTAEFYTTKVSALIDRDADVVRQLLNRERDKRLREGGQQR